MRTVVGAWIAWCAAAMLTLPSTLMGARPASPGAAPADGSIFDGSSVVELTLEAPIDDLFARAEADPDYSVTGRLSWRFDGREGSIDRVQIAERGHTSRRASECEFPKLKIDFGPQPSQSTADTPFAGMAAVKLGTHCGDSPDGQLTPKYGRLSNEHAPHREALTYQILHAADVPTLLARPARITYVFSGGATRSPLTRGAMLLEDDDDARERVGGTSEIKETEFGSARDSMDPRDTARLAFAEAMLGNFDWCLRMFPGDIYRCDGRHPLWNILAFTREGGGVVPLMYDFDISGPVVGRHVWFAQIFDAGFVEPPSTIEVEVRAQVQRTRSLFGRELLDQTRAHFLGVRARVLEAIERGLVDDQGREFARQYVGAFYRAIEDDTRFYGPIVVEGGYQASLDPEGTRPACAARSLVPEGTPVSAPVETRGEMARVRILDALWQWTGDNRCDAIRTQPIWIASRAIGTVYPR
jgi:hypothetical protein